MITDINGKTFSENMVVEIRNAWGKTDNGLWVVEHAYPDGLWLRKLNKDMRKSTNKLACTGWPLHCYHNDYYKRHEINSYNDAHAEIQVLCPWVEPEAKPVSNDIKIQKRGIRKGESYCSCWYSKNRDNSVTIYARHYNEHIPREIGNVRNESNSMIDYFETDSCTLRPGDTYYEAALACCK